MDYQDALDIAKKELGQPPYFGIVDIGEADDFWAFFGGYLDGVARDENPSIVVVMKSSGEVVRPIIPSTEGFALLSRIAGWEDE